MRLDKYLLELHPNLTRSKSQDLIKRGLVLVNNKVITKTGYEIKQSDEIQVLDLLKYVSRAGLKLEHAANILNLNFSNLKVLDVGSSTGGFSDYSIQNGASIVYAYDVGTNQMDKDLRNNPKIVLNEQTNILSATIPNVDIALVDVSFTSSKQILKHIYNHSNVFLILIKPQFEVGKDHLKKGIVKDKKRVQALLDEFKKLATDLGFQNIKIFPTNLPGKDGNLEYWLYLEK
ncbi:MAG: TlyA family RNA methyltransferase [Acholeplasmataceae bacterium]|nr:TlyA family RNA methyltransferase [Acholeplasmataceae bacterium]